MEVSEKMKFYLESDIGKAVLTLLAYTVNTTITKKDDEILANVDEVVQIVADAISKISDNEVNVLDAKDAALLILTKVAESTENKWDDRMIPILKMFL